MQPPHLCSGHLLCCSPKLCGTAQGIREENFAPSSAAESSQQGSRACSTSSEWPSVPRAEEGGSHQATTPVLQRTAGGSEKGSRTRGQTCLIKESRKAQAGDPSIISFFINLPRPSILPHRHHCCGCRSSWCPSGSATQVPGTIPVTLERRSPPHGAQELRHRSICPNCSPSR